MCSIKAWSQFGAGMPLQKMQTRAKPIRRSHRPETLRILAVQCHFGHWRSRGAAMPRAVQISEPVDLGALDAFLMSDRAPEKGMGLSDLDGFLTAIAIGPELIMPSEWLPLIWGGEEPTFDGFDEAQEILSLIMARYNEIISTLQGNAEDWDPIFWEVPGGEVIASDWAAGFMNAVRLRADAWEPLIEDREAGALMVPIIFAGSETDLAEEMGLDPSQAADLLRDAADDIPVCVIGIDLFWKERRLAGPHTASARSAKVGRNEPCSCGSGKKYKRCCGLY
jgi:uncharacterized protein